MGPNAFIPGTAWQHLLTTFSGPCTCRHAWRMAQPTMPHSSTGHQPMTGKLRLEQLHGTSLMGECFCSDV